MKRRLAYFLAISITVVLTIVIISWYFTPRAIDRTLHGIEYRLGDDNENNIEHITIVLKGKIHKQIFRDRVLKGKTRKQFSPQPLFKGTIQVNDHLLPPTESVDEVLEIRLGELWNGGFIQYNTAGVGTHTVYGVLVTDKHVSRLTIVQYEQRSPSFGWRSEDGMMISAPATNRSEALQISNDFMRHFLQEPLK